MLAVQWNGCCAEIDVSQEEDNLRLCAIGIGAVVEDFLSVAVGRRMCGASRDGKGD